MASGTASSRKLTSRALYKRPRPRDQESTGDKVFHTRCDFVLEEAASGSGSLLQCSLPAGRGAGRAARHGAAGRRRSTRNVAGEAADCAIFVHYIHLYVLYIHVYVSICLCIFVYMYVSIIHVSIYVYACLHGEVPRQRIARARRVAGGQAGGRYNM